MTELSMSMLDNYIQKAIDFGVNVLIAIIFFVIGRFIIKGLLNIIRKIFDKSSVDTSVSRFLESLLKFVMYGILIIIICDKVGIQTTSFIAVLTSASLTVGLALQGSLSNFAGGVLILVMKPFAIGDYISSSLGEGVVYKIDIFYTTLTTIDNKRIMIPNGALSDGAITNYSKLEKRMIIIEIGIAYDSDIAKAKQAIFDVIEKNQYLLDKENNMVVVKELSESQITLQVRTWVKTEDYWTGYFELNEQIKLALDKNGIEIPFKQLDVFIKNKGETSDK